MARCAWIKVNSEQCPYDDNGSGYCNDHEGVECCMCGAQATHECGVTTHNLLCYAPVCGSCQTEHENKCHAVGSVL